MISVAMGTYNGEKYLDEQLRSLAEQTLLPAELVVCDDGSTDSTPDIVKRFAATAPFPVRFFANEERLGFARNFIKAASLCTSEYIAFCDQDDVWLKDKLAVGQKYIDRTKCLLFQHGYRLIDEAGNVISKDYSGEEGQGRWAFTRGLSQIFHRSLLSFAPLREHTIDQTQVKTAPLPHDIWMRFIASLMGGAVLAKEVLIHYRRHNQNASELLLNQELKTNFKGTLLITASRWGGRPQAYNEKRAYIVAMLGRMAAGAGSRAAVIELLKREWPKEKLAVLDRDIKYYEKYAKYQQDRLSVYKAKSRVKGLQKIVSLYFSGSYQAFGSRGLKDSVLDVLYGAMN